MKKNKFKLSRNEIILISIFLFFLVWLIILLILRNYSEICESYVRNYSNPIVSFITSITSHIPFSLTEICILFSIIVCISSLVLFIVFMVKKHFRIAIHIISSVFVFVLGVSTCYVSLSGLNYNREAINLKLYEEEVDSSSYNDIVKYFIDDFNYCSSTLEYLDNGMVKMPYTLDQLNNIMINEYKKLDSNNYFATYTGKGKPLISSYIFSQLHITGMSFSLLGEANINMLNSNHDYPFTLAHELAHQKGVMREEDANLTALYICLTSDLSYLRYSAYMRSIGSLLDLLNYTNIKDNYKNVYETINKNILTDMQVSSQYMASFNLIGEVGAFFNNIYLTLFGNGGINAYDDVPIIVDTGEKDEDGNIIYDIEFSPYQKLYFELYYNG